MKIAILGASGLLGSSLVPFLRNTSWKIYTIGRDPSNEYICDVVSRPQLDSILSLIKPNIIINLVALTDVDFCESNPNLAFLVNVSTVNNIVEWMNVNKESHLIHISTDQVYDGNGPHLEPYPMLSNYYAFSKYTAEQVAIRVPSTILRTNFFGKSRCTNRSSFTDWIYESLTQEKKITLFNDVQFSPLSIQSLLSNLKLLISTKILGIYNLASKEGFSKSEFVIQFANELNLSLDNVDIKSINDVNFMKTYRPKDMRLNVDKYEKITKLKLPKLKDEINQVIGDYNEATR